MLFTYIAILLVVFSFLWIGIWFWFFRIDDVKLKKLSEIGKQAFDAGHFKKAKAIFAKIMKKDKSLELKYKMGVSMLELNELKQARSCFEAILGVNPNHVMSILKLGEVEKRDRNYAKALEYFTLALKKDPKNVTNYINVAEIYYLNQEYQKAIEVYEKASEIDPECPEVILGLLSCKTELCNLDSEYVCDSLIEEYEKVEALVERLPKYHFEVAKTHAKSGNVKKAIDHCKKSVENNPNDFESYRLLGLLMLIRQDYDAAKDALTKAIEICPDSKETHNILSYVMCQQMEGLPFQACRLEYYDLIKGMLKK
ncbi:MAG: tetratricopeptide repeat protein [bacterium]|nr:tetratricopeptide repeat protein [bacterium]